MIARFPEPLRPFRPRLGVDEKRIEAAAFGLAEESQQARPVAMGVARQLGAVRRRQADTALPVRRRDVDADFVKGVLPFGHRRRRIAPWIPQLDQIPLVVLDHPVERRERRVALRHPGLVRVERAEQIVPARRVDARPHVQTAGRERELASAPLSPGGTRWGGFLLHVRRLSGLVREGGG